MHYFSVCSGSYVLSNSNPSLLTSTKTNISCSRQWSGYNFSLHDTVLSTLHSEVRGLASGLTDWRWSTQSQSSAWYTGMSNVFLCFVVLSFKVAGKSGWWSETIVMSFVSSLFSSIALPRGEKNILTTYRSHWSASLPLPASFLRKSLQSATSLEMASGRILIRPDFWL